MTQYDHIIIGTGINALVAGAMLSRKGKKVLLLERAETIGGCMVTQEATLPGFHHDVMAATFVMFTTSPAYQELGDDLARHGLLFCNSEHPTGVLRPDGSALVLTTDRARNVASFGQLHTADGAQHSEDMTEIEADAPFLFALLGGPLWARRTAWLMGQQVFKKGLNGLKAWIGTALTPARAWLESNYQSPLIQALWAPWVLHAGLTPDATASGQMGKVIGFALEGAGAPVVQGGAANAAKAFQSLIEEHGGDIRTNTDVTRILTKNNKAFGVETANGERVLARQVLASVTPSQLYGHLLREDAPTEDQDNARRFRYGRGNFQLHFALDAEPEWIAEGLSDVALLHLADGIDSVSKSANEAERGQLPATPTICVGQPHRLDPSRCPDGKAILWLQIPDAPREMKGDAAGEIETGNGWDAPTREAFADRLEGILAQHIRNWDSIKLARRAYSPADLEQMNVNLVGGDPYGGQCSIDQFFVFRPFVQSRNGETAIRNLHHIGASTHPGPGLGGGSGFNIAKKLGA